VLLPDHGFLDQVRLELAGHDGGAMAAHAHQPGSAGRQPFDRGNADLFSKAAADHFALVERDEYLAAHRLSPRLAAAMASRKLP